MQKSRFKKGVLIFSLSLLGIAVLVATGLTFAFVYARKTVNYSEDELLFSAAKEGSAIHLYADGDPYDEKYTPIEIETVYPRAGEMEWIKYEKIPSSVDRKSVV